MRRVAIGAAIGCPAPPLFSSSYLSMVWEFINIIIINHHHHHGSLSAPPPLCCSSTLIYRLHYLPSKLPKEGDLSLNYFSVVFMAWIDRRSCWSVRLTPGESKKFKRSKLLFFLHRGSTVVPSTYVRALHTYWVFRYSVILCMCCNAANLVITVST
ncbi:hypothetical protein F4805DRAFT_257421 [Annulohypoxylon moriforme]|nr:hypothetical protein F4805DRAFT_257421 [Annulohypoxylon moriforme]